MSHHSYTYLATTSHEIRVRTDLLIPQQLVLKIQPTTHHLTANYSRGTSEIHVIMYSSHSSNNDHCQWWSGNDSAHLKRHSTKKHLTMHTNKSWPGECTEEPLTKPAAKSSLCYNPSYFSDTELAIFCLMHLYSKTIFLFYSCGNCHQCANVTHSSLIP